MLNNSRIDTCFYIMLFKIKPQGSWYTSILLSQKTEEASESNAIMLLDCAAKQYSNSNSTSSSDTRILISNEKYTADMDYDIYTPNIFLSESKQYLLYLMPPTIMI